MRLFALLRRNRNLQAERDALQGELLKSSQAYAETKWGAWYTDALRTLVDYEMSDEQIRKAAIRAAILADAALECYEERWGKESEE